MELDVGRPLSGRVEIDDAYPGGAHDGRKGGCARLGETPTVTVVETRRAGGQGR
jgi:hypothetical protein